MLYKKFFNNTYIPSIGLGTSGLDEEIKKEGIADRRFVAIIRSAIKHEAFHIDTAEEYGNGRSEELIGGAIKFFDRKEIFITTKISPKNLGYRNIFMSAGNSLRRLGSAYVDLCLIHAPNPYIPLCETMKAMDSLVGQGKIKLIGVSNFSVDQIKKAQKYSQNKISVNQIEYNLIVRNKGRFTDNMESEIIPFCQENNILIIAYKPFAGGLIFAKKLPLLFELSKKYNKTQAQIALNWLISKDQIVTIPKTSSLKHLKENIAASEWVMERDDIKKLDELEFNL